MKNSIWKSTKILVSAVCCTFLFLLTTCDIQNEQVFPAEPEFEKSKTDPVAGPVALNGKSFYSVYSKLNKEYIGAPPEDFYLDIKAFFTRTGKQNFCLYVEEYNYGLKIRMIEYLGKITPGGAVTFIWPETYIEFKGFDEEWNPIYGEVTGSVLEIMSGHTGYEFSGRGVNKGQLLFKGHFEKGHFFAEASLNAMQVQEGTVTLPGVIDYTVIVNGPISFKISYDLNVDVIE